MPNDNNKKTFDVKRNSCNHCQTQQDKCLPSYRNNGVCIYHSEDHV